MSKLIRLFPQPGFYIQGVPHVVQDVTPERAAELLAYRPPAFTTDPPQEPAPEPEGPLSGGSPDPEGPLSGGSPDPEAEGA